MALLSQMTLVGRCHEFAIIVLTATGMGQLETANFVSDSPADSIRQWYNAGGMISFYDYPLDTQLEASLYQLFRSS